MRKYVFIAFIFLAGFFKGLQDHCTFHSKACDPTETWTNKYLLDTNGALMEFKGWWYLGLYEPAHMEKFPYSSTALVGFTDRWHSWGMFRMFSWALAIFFSFYFLVPHLFTTYELMKTDEDVEGMVAHELYPGICWFVLVWFVAGVWFVRMLGFHLAYTILN